MGSGLDQSLGLPATSWTLEVMDQNQDQGEASEALTLSIGFKEWRRKLSDEEKLKLNAIFKSLIGSHDPQASRLFLSTKVCAFFNISRRKVDSDNPITPLSSCSDNIQKVVVRGRGACCFFSVYFLVPM
jgi:hypothetical protein